MTRRIRQFSVIMIITSLNTLLIETPHTAISASDSQDLAQLIGEVRQIPVQGSPGTIIPFGPEAFPLIVGDVGENRVLPVVAAARLGKGRIVAFSHGSYLADAPKDDWKRLVLNSIEWAGAGHHDKKPGARRVVTYRMPALLTMLKSSTHQASAVNAKNWSKQLSESDVICIDTSFQNDPELMEAVAKFVRDGGGLVTAGTGWGWAQLNPGKSLANDYLGNRLLMQAGLIVSDHMASGKGDQFVVVQPPPKLSSAWEALAQMSSQPITAAKKVTKKATSKRPKDGSTQGSFVLEAALRSIPPRDTIIWPKIRELVKGKAAIPMPGWAVATENVLARFSIIAEDIELQALPPEKIKAHPAAAGFPFSVPADAQPVTARRKIDTKKPDWHSLGLYAAPGALIKVSVPREVVPAQLTIQVGCHTDQLWHLPTWERWPNISRRIPITTETTTLATPFGGLVYIDVPQSCTAGTIEVTISGAIESPLYVLGKTDLDDWKKRIRNLPGPWAELQCNGVIVTVPSKSIRKLDNPKPVMEFWNRAVELEDELAMYQPGDRKRPERFVADQQISAGYMHSGYPIMAGNDVYEANVTLAQLRGTSREPGGWGHWHELGHNHQDGAWTPDSTGEVTVNLFTMYVMNKLHGVPIEATRPDVLSPENRRLKIHEYLASKRTANDWDAFEGLVMYFQLIDAFGWKKLQDLFGEYRKLEEAARPQTDEEKWDQWMVRYSRAVNKNLGPFFVRWRVPVTKKALESIQKLPPWMHSDFAGIRK
jgi:hypothetical protein